MARCNSCNGNKKVMGIGGIQMKTCPTCQGTGIDPESRGYELKTEKQEENKAEIRDDLESIMENSSNEKQKDIEQSPKKRGRPKGNK